MSYLAEHGIAEFEPLFALVRYQIDLRSSDADLNSLLALVREAEQKTGEKCVWIIVDTLSRAMAGGDENSPVDIRRIVASADRFRSETGAHFTYVHHTGKARGARGHSLLRAATDTEIETSASSMALTKQRDGELGFQIGFTLVDIDIGRDPNGLAVKSAVVEWKIKADAPASKKRKEPPANLRMLVTVVQQALMDSDAPPIRPFLDGQMVKAVTDEVVRRRYYMRVAEKADAGEDAQKLADRKRRAFYNAVKNAIDKEVLMACNINGTRYLWMGKEG